MFIGLLIIQCYCEGVLVLLLCSLYIITSIMHCNNHPISCLNIVIVVIPFPILSSLSFYYCERLLIFLLSTNVLWKFVFITYQYVCIIWSSFTEHNYIFCLTSRPCMSQIVSSIRFFRLSSDKTFRVLWFLAFSVLFCINKFYMNVLLVCTKPPKWYLLWNQGKTYTIITVLFALNYQNYIYCLQVKSGKTHYIYHYYYNIYYYCYHNWDITKQTSILKKEIMNVAHVYR